MKRLFLLIIGILPILLFAQSAEKGRNGKVIIRDRQGYIVEIRSIDRNGNFIIEDPRGQIIQIISKDLDGNILIEDLRDNSVYSVPIGNNPHHGSHQNDIYDYIDDYGSVSIKTDVFGNTIYERNGKTLFKVGINIFDEKFIEDGNGNQLRKIKRDVFGNKIVEGEKGKEILKLDEINFERLLFNRGLTEEQWENIIIEEYIQFLLSRY